MRSDCHLVVHLLGRPLLRSVGLQPGQCVGELIQGNLSGVGVPQALDRTLDLDLREIRSVPGEEGSDVGHIDVSVVQVVDGAEEVGLVEVLPELQVGQGAGHLEGVGELVQE